MKNKISSLFIFLSMLFAFSLLFTLPKKAIAETNNQILSKSAYLVDADTGTVLLKKDENKRLPIASMCKVMTLLVAFEKIDNNELFLDENIIVSDRASSMGGSQVFLEEDGEYSVDQLIKSIVVSSANDSCVAIAERICGYEDAFVDLMNSKAKELKMENTNFVNCTGLPKEGQYSCAKDVAIMFNALTTHKSYFNYSKIWMDKIHHPKDRITEISNTNKLIRNYNGCIGGKTGYTSEAGHCLTAFATRNNTNLISVVIGAPDSKTRFKETSDLFNYGFENFFNKKVVDKADSIKIDCYIKGSKNVCELLAKEDVSFLLKKGDKTTFETNIKLNDNLVAPLEKDEVVGKLQVFKNAELVKEVDVVLAKKVYKKSYFDNLVDTINNWCVVS